MQDKVWVTRDGRKILVSQMETSHIVRCIAMILRNRNWRREYLDRLRIELIARSIKDG